ncbi:S-adenosyl-L-methionine-dependent methyltransferase [Coniella lustricola]|uniref:S-adenosyl-L-methionine-dependent methyltransferase n=1 Tax=Coniella lustricola TaxID=2025994 RepID=A0A2T3AI54_9PEZI|nr:S-adenosyl-L-methionine-dependent methyltransferase [Coniella lustricola]
MRSETLMRSGGGQSRLTYLNHPHHQQQQQQQQHEYFHHHSQSVLPRLPMLISHKPLAGHQTSPQIAMTAPREGSGDMGQSTAQRQPTGSTIPDALSIQEHGRMFNAYRQGKYLMPNDGEEQNRLDLQHYVWQTMVHNRLNFAPIRDDSRVLDIGTGTGIWAIEFAKRYPKSTVVGTDISLIQPTYSLPMNCSFEREDAEDEWMFDAPFDYIRWRLMASCFRSYKDMIYKVYAHLAPGGWAEFHEWAYEACADNAETEEYYNGSALRKWLEYVVGGGASLGRDLRSPLHYRQWMIEAGFTEVTVRHFSVPLNGWPQEPAASTLGNMACVNCLQFVNSVTKFLLAGGLSRDALPAFVDEVRANVRDRRMRISFPSYVIYGRKPDAPATHHGESMRVDNILNM